MRHLQALFSGFRAFLPILVISFAIFYFLMSALQGNNGLFRFLQLSAQTDILEEELAGLEAERRALENLTNRLSNDFLDLDLLDEQARKRLGYIRDDEIIIR